MGAVVCLSLTFSVACQEARFFRIVGPSATVITSASPDGTISWTTAAVGVTCTVQVTMDLGSSNWVDYVQVPISNSVTVCRIFDPNPPPGMALIPAGSFTMGYTDPEGGSELPLHTVYVSEFYMDRYDVTKALWDEVRDWALANGYTFEHGALGKAANYPAWMLWYDAVLWCNARSEKEGRTPAYYTDADQTNVYRGDDLPLQNGWVKWNTGYRLPTEAEWEKAARGGASGHRFSWRNAETITHNDANYYSTNSLRYDISPESGYHPAFNDNVLPYSSPVGHFGANGYGLYDMTGNVWQWCWDWFGSYTNTSQSDPRGPESGLYRVKRGGSWKSTANMCRVASRSSLAPFFGDTDIGFRCVLPSSQP